MNYQKSFWAKNILQSQSERYQTEKIQKNSKIRGRKKEIKLKKNKI